MAPKGINSKTAKSLQWEVMFHVSLLRTIWKNFVTTFIVVFENCSSDSMLENKKARKRSKLPLRSTEMTSWLISTGMLPGENEPSVITVIQHASVVYSNCPSMRFPVDISCVHPVSKLMATKCPVAQLSR